MEVFTVIKKLLTDKNMGIITKKKLIRSYAWSVALYRCKAWTINKRDTDYVAGLRNVMSEGDAKSKLD